MPGRLRRYQDVGDLHMVTFGYRNPVNRGLVAPPELWRSSSLRQYLDRAGVVNVSTGRSAALVAAKVFEEGGFLLDLCRPDP